MFASHVDDELRQGDICVIDYFPIWDLSTVGFISDSKGKRTGVTLQLSGRLVTEETSGDPLVIVCSHDCDLEEPKKRTGLLIAPLVGLPAGPHETERRAAIKASSAVNERSEYEYIHLFPLDLPDGLGARECVVDFSAAASVLRAEAATQLLLGRKVAQMEDAVRTQLRLKLAAFLGRDYQTAK